MRVSVQRVDHLVGQDGLSEQRRARPADLDPDEAAGRQGVRHASGGFGIDEGVLDGVGCGVADPVRGAARDHGGADVAAAGGGVSATFARACPQCVHGFRAQKSRKEEGPATY